MRWLVCMIAVVAALPPLIAVGQWFAPDPFFGGGFGPATAAESYQRGFADVVRSAGQANLMDSMAAQNYEKVRAMDIENRLKWTEAYFQMRQMNRAMRAAKQLPRLTPEQLAQNARQNLPTRLTSRQLDPVNGQIDWPVVLRNDQYAAEREKLDSLFQQRATTSSIAPENYRDVQKYTGELLAALRKNVRDYSANDWTQARRFVESLAFEVRFASG